MRYRIHPKGRPSAWSWVNEAELKKTKAHPHGKNMVIAEEDNTPSEFAHPRPILPGGIEEKVKKAKATTEATPAPQPNKGKTNGA